MNTIYINFEKSYFLQQDKRSASSVKSAYWQIELTRQKGLGNFTID